MAIDRSAMPYYPVDISLGLLIIDVHQRAQHFTRTPQARTYRSNRHVKYFGGLVVAHSFETDEQHDRALSFGETAQGVIEFAELSRRGRICRGRQGRRYLVDVDRNL